MPVCFELGRALLNTMFQALVEFPKFVLDALALTNFFLEIFVGLFQVLDCGPKSRRTWESKRFWHQRHEERWQL